MTDISALGMMVCVGIVCLTAYKIAIKYIDYLYSTQVLFEFEDDDEDDDEIE